MSLKKRSSINSDNKAPTIFNYLLKINIMIKPSSCMNAICWDYVVAFEQLPALD